MEGDALQVDVGNLVDVLLVLAAHDDVGDAGALGSEDFLLDAAHGQHLAAQGYLARHGRVLAHLALCQRRCYGGGNGDACRRSVLRCGAFGHVDVDVPVVEDAVVHTQSLHVGLHVFQGDDGTLLHHVAQVARQRQLAGLALRQRCLDEQNLAAHARPCQSGDHACVVVALVDVAVEGRLAQQSLQLVGRYLRRGHLAFQLSLVGQFAHGLVDLLLQLSDAALARVLFNNFLYGCLVEGQLRGQRLEARVVEFAGDEVALGNLNLLLGDVAADLDNLHAVE